MKTGPKDIEDPDNYDPTQEGFAEGQILEDIPDFDNGAGDQGNEVS